VLQFPINGSVMESVSSQVCLFWYGAANVSEEPVAAIFRVEE
jgi:hypothetical protein